MDGAQTQLSQTVGNGKAKASLGRVHEPPGSGLTVEKSDMVGFMFDTPVYHPIQCERQ